jgi:single stranded DNA-binding protein
MQKNRIELAGYLATKPEARFLPSGTKVANARLKESYRFTGTDGKQQTHANWHSLVFYGELADVALSYEKDDNLYIEGSFNNGSSRRPTASRVLFMKCTHDGDRAVWCVGRRNADLSTARRVLFA